MVLKVVEVGVVEILDHLIPFEGEVVEVEYWVVVVEMHLELQGKEGVEEEQETYLVMLLLGVEEVVELMWAFL